MILINIEEILYRREMILTTISSLQRFFLSRYIGGQRQCRLGYDSSPQCDSFQLGEMVRFFTRKGTLSLQSMLIDRDNFQFYKGSIERLFSSLRECPPYQLDSNHSHCGLRDSDFMPALRHLEWMCTQTDQIGVCLQCWRNHRSEHSWRSRLAGDPWRYKQSMHQERRYEKQFRVREHDHSAAKNLFTATEHVWISEI